MERNKKIWWIVRLVLMAAAVTGFAVFAVPLSISVSVNIGNVTGIAVAAVLFFYGLFMPGVHRILNLWKKHKILRWLYRGILCGIALIALLVVVESGCMLYAANQKPEPGATVVVLGCRVYGERASLSMRERLEAAYEYLMEHGDSVCVLSGGKGDGENITEAECMYRYLVDKGIALERLYKEETSTTTRENLLFSKQLIEEHGLNPVIAIATSDYHEYRAGLIAESLGLEYAAVPGRTALWLFPTYYVRELYAILYEWVF
ncbi:MAG: YdcF family protein [Lachnospiraceae bacterium]|nr:YdcF family protein [Lachnospiraceae bacterium]